MRITELVGARRHPAYQAAQQLTRRSWGDPDWSELADSPEVKNLDQELGRLGWQRRGQGSFGVVYQHTQKPYVIKVFVDGGGWEYLKWIKYVQQHQDNPHLPRLYGSPRQISSTAWAIRMEVLQNITRAAIRNYINPEIDVSDKDRHRLLEELVGDANGLWLQKHHPQLHQAIEAAYSFGDDLVEGGQNIMQRNGVLVLIDP